MPIAKWSKSGFWSLVVVPITNIILGWSVQILLFFVEFRSSLITHTRILCILISFVLWFVYTHNLKFGVISYVQQRDLWEINEFLNMLMFYAWNWPVPGHTTYTLQSLVEKKHYFLFFEQKNNLVLQDFKYETMFFLLTFH